MAFIMASRWVVWSRTFLTFPFNCSTSSFNESCRFWSFSSGVYKQQQQQQQMVASSSEWNCMQCQPICGGIRSVPQSLTLSLLFLCPYQSTKHIRDAPKVHLPWALILYTCCRSYCCCSSCNLVYWLWFVLPWTVINKLNDDNNCNNYNNYNNIAWKWNLFSPNTNSIIIMYSSRTFNWMVTLRFPLAV